MRDKVHHLRLEALLIDLASYGATFGQGDDLQQLWAEALEGASRWSGGGDNEPIELPTFSHEEKRITYPATSRPLPAKVKEAAHLTAFFDGGAAKKLGTGGFVVYGGTGECITA